MQLEMADHISQLKRLVADLERLQAGSILAPDFVAVPVPDQWTHSVRKVPCLEGIVGGHPSLFKGRWIVTSEVFAHARMDDEHFVRTRSRWYWLGDRNLNTKHRGGPLADNTMGA